ncbi:MAG: DegT/DnrJ/EryC1/StrS family aminotransferase [Candidatus Sungbacteria bacterium]|uniref:DegT/DnrJ/EryC1/StrS family aminotransferase n=1 Tax=Candidatus Sungiibacteriota bacterium TaxID=2750080 RepID=A0A933DSY3_9BACT|nr:DegT/DnrJ/EryC1/StrS family aminotransferase [Candidatus Sungbacteria bacterium]
MKLKKRKTQIGVGGMVVTPLHKRLVMQVLDSGRFSYGPFLKRFEAEFARRHNRRFAVATNSGTSALITALRALKDGDGWKDGDEIIVPALTFIATSNAILHNGLWPVFADVDPRSFHIDPAEIEKRITKRTRAIMPVHLWGVSCEMAPIIKMARKHGLRVVEDSAQALGVLHRGKPVGSQGDIACYSTYVSHIVTTGEGGMLLTNDPKIAIRSRSLISHGRDNIYMAADDDRGLSGARLAEVMGRRFQFVTAGFNFRANEIGGALGIAEFSRLGENLATRRGNAGRLLKGFAPFAEHLQLPWWPPHSEHSFMMFPVAVRSPKFSRDELTHFLESWNVETRPLYPLLTQPAYKKLFGNIARNYPVATFAQKNGFFIGCHPELGKSETDYVVSVFREFFRKKGLLKE